MHSLDDSGFTKGKQLLYAGVSSPHTMATRNDIHTTQHFATEAGMKQPADPLRYVNRPTRCLCGNNIVRVALAESKTL